MSYYYEATHNQSNKVWDKFGKDEKSYKEGYSYKDEVDDKKSNISVTNSKDENIEDKYYGESDKTYVADEHYFKVSVNHSESSLPVVLILLGGFILYTLK